MELPEAAQAADAYQRFAATTVIMSESLCEAMGLRAGWRVLDVGAGTGNAALAAARRAGAVTALDVDIDMLARARVRAVAEGLPLSAVVGDAERVPLPDGSVDAVVSTLGVMFADDQQAAADELVRVCRPGGVIGLANWARNGWTDELLHTLVSLISGGQCQCPGACGDETAPTPFRWGSERGLRSLFPHGLASLTVTPRTFYARHRSPEHLWTFLTETNGFIRACLASAGPGMRERMRGEVMTLLKHYDHADDGTVVLAQDYVEVVATAALAPSSTASRSDTNRGVTDVTTRAD